MKKVKDVFQGFNKKHTKYDLDKEDFNLRDVYDKMKDEEKDQKEVDNKD